MQLNGLSYLIIMGRELVEELLDSVLLSGAVHVGNLLLRQGREVQLHLELGHQRVKY